MALAADDDGCLMSPDGDGSVDASGFSGDWESAVVECRVDEMVGGSGVDAHVVGDEEGIGDLEGVGQHVFSCAHLMVSRRLTRKVGTAL